MARAGEAAVVPDSSAAQRHADEANELPPIQISTKQRDCHPERGQGHDSRYERITPLFRRFNPAVLWDQRKSEDGCGRHGRDDSDSQARERHDSPHQPSLARRPPRPAVADFMVR